MSSRAAQCADIWSGNAHVIALATIYRDGVILYLTTTEKTQDAIVEALIDEVVEQSRSLDGLCGVVILKPDRWIWAVDRAATMVRQLLGETLQFVDNRQRDHNTIGALLGEGRMP